MTGLERSEASDLYARLSAQAADARAEADRLTKMVRGLENIIQGLTDLYPDLQPGATTVTPGTPVPVTAELVQASNRPKLSSVEIVARVVREASNGAALTVPDVYMEMEDRGWLPEADDPLAAVRTALARARNKGLVSAVKLDGRSKGYLPPENASAPVAAGAEDGDESDQDSSREEGGGRDGRSTPLEDHDGGVRSAPDHHGLPGDRASVGG